MTETIIIIVALLVIVPVGIWYYDNTPAKTRRRRELEQRMQLVKGWIVYADKGLRDGSNKIGGPCKIVFALERNANDEQLKTVAHRLAETATSFEVQKEDFGQSQQISIALTDGLKAFTTVVWVSPSHLPAGLLTQPYIMCKVCASDNQEPMAGASMVRQEA